MVRKILDQSVTIEDRGYDGLVVQTSQGKFAIKKADDTYKDSDQYKSLD
jgi:hypothetical protein